MSLHRTTKYLRSSVILCGLDWYMVIKCQPTTRNIPEERRNYLHYGGSRITRKNYIILISEPMYRQTTRKTNTLRRSRLTWTILTLSISEFLWCHKINNVSAKSTVC